jgi:hypothetical protein
LTWSKDATKNEIDFILVKQDQKKCMKNINVLNQFDFDSDHKLVRLTIEIDRLYVVRKKLSRGKIIIPDDKSKIKAFNEQILSLDKDKDYPSLISALQKSSSMFKVNNKQDKIIRDETKIEIDRREALRKLRHNSDTDEINFRVQRKKVNNLISNDVRKFEINKVEAAIDRRKGWRKAKKAVSDGKNCILKIKNDKDELLTDRDAIVEEFSKFYEKLYASTLSADERAQRLPDLSQISSDIDEISFEEMKSALVALKNDRSPGDDGVTAELLKICSDEVIEKFQLQFNQILVTEKVPVEWLESTIILVHKKGDKTNISNYRPISKTSHVYKWFMKVLQMRIKPEVETFQTPAQAGFRKGYSITDHLFTISQVIEKCNEFNIEAHIGLMDYAKAFDSLEHWHLYQGLVDAGVDFKYIRIVKNIYDNSTARIKMESLSRPFKIERGIKQGCVCSTDFFINSLEKIYRTIDLTQHGIDVNDKKLVDLRFADDRAVICKSKSDLEQAMTKISEASKEAGLTDNFQKTKIITNSSCQSYTVKGVEIKVSQSEKYLGQKISFIDQEAEINERIAAGWRAFHANKKFLCGALPMYHKRELFEKNVLSVLTFGSQNWTLTNAQKEKLAVVQHDMERRVLHVRRIDKVKLSKIRSLTKWRDINEFSSILKFRWAGHVARMENSRWPNRMLNWNPNGKRSRGRPKPRWEEDIKKHAGFSWKRTALKREKWAKLANSIRTFL